MTLIYTHHQSLKKNIEHKRPKLYRTQRAMVYKCIKHLHKKQSWCHHTRVNGFSIVNIDQIEVVRGMLTLQNWQSPTKQTITHLNKIKNYYCAQWCKSKIISVKKQSCDKNNNL